MTKLDFLASGRKEDRWARAPKGHTTATVLSLAAVLISIGALVVGVNSQLETIATRQAANELFTALKELAAGNVRPAGGESAFSAPADPAGAVLSDEEYAAVMEKDFKRLSGYGPGQEKATTAPAAGASGSLPADPPLDQAFAPEAAPAENGAAVNINELFRRAPTVILSPPTIGGSLGKAALAVYNGWTFFKLAAVNLPPLPADEYYAAWLTDPLSNASVAAGAMAYEASTSEAVLFFEQNRNLSAYREIMVTRERGPAAAPGQVVLIGQFPAGAPFAVDPKGLGPDAESPNAAPPDENGTYGSVSAGENRALIEKLLGTEGAAAGTGGAASLEDLLGGGITDEKLLLELLADHP